MSWPMSVEWNAAASPSVGSANEQRQPLTSPRAAALVHSALHVSQVRWHVRTRSVRLSRHASMSAPDSGASRSRENWSSQ